jgi:hypothetical protein
MDFCLQKYSFTSFDRIERFTEAVALFSFKLSSRVEILVKVAVGASKAMSLFKDKSKGVELRFVSKKPPPTELP